MEPPSSMLAIFWTCGATLQKARISSFDRRASMKRMSAPCSRGEKLTSAEPTLSSKTLRFVLSDRWRNAAIKGSGAGAPRDARQVREGGGAPQRLLERGHGPRVGAGGDEDVSPFVAGVDGGADAGDRLLAGDDLRGEDARQAG